VHTAPFAALFQAYCATALTHIAEDIRVDALTMLTLWTRRFPDQMFRFRDKVRAGQGAAGGISRG